MDSNNKVSNNSKPAQGILELLGNKGQLVNSFNMFLRNQLKLQSVDVVAQEGQTQSDPINNIKLTTNQSNVINVSESRRSQRAELERLLS